MQAHSESPKPVARWIRALAVLFTLILAAEVVLLPYLALKHSFPSPTWKTVAYGVLILWLGPLFAFVAVKGRAPRSWPLLGDYLWRTKR